MTSLLPPEFNTVTLTGQYVNLDGTPVVGYLTFTPSPTILRAVASKDLIIPVTIQVPLDESGHFSLALPATDDPDINPDHWTYQVLEGFGARRTYSVQILLEAGTEQNIFDLAPVPMRNGTFYDIGPAGPAGPPAIITSGVPASTAGGTGDYAIDAVNGVLYGPKSQLSGWGAGVHLAATDIAAHAALVNSHGIGVGSVLVGTTDTQTLSGKTLAAPTVTGGLTTDTVHATGSAQIDGNATITGDINARNITGALGAFSAATVTAVPANPADVVRKDYADALGTSANAINTIVRRDATGMTNFQKAFINAAPVTASEATRKDYVDAGDTTATNNARRVQSVALPANGGARTLALTDEGTQLYSVDGTPISVTVPPNFLVSFPIGSWVEFRAVGGGAITMQPGSGVSISAPDGVFTTRTTRSVMRLLKTGTDTWTLYGDTNDAVAQAAQTVTAATSVSTASTIAKRDAAGRLQVVDPSAAADVATKSYVDSTDISTRRIIWNGNTLAASYTLAATDEWKQLSNAGTSPTDLVVNLPLNSSVALPVGFQVDLNRHQTANLTINGSAVTLYMNGVLTSSFVLPYRFATVRLLKVATDTWYGYVLTNQDTGWTAITDASLSILTGWATALQGGVGNVYRVQNGRCSVRLGFTSPSSFTSVADAAGNVGDVQVCTLPSSVPWPVAGQDIYGMWSRIGFFSVPGVTVNSTGQVAIRSWFPSVALPGAVSNAFQFDYPIG